MLFKLLLLFSIYLPFQLAINPTAGVDLASGRVIILLLFFCWILQGLKNKKILITDSIQSLFIISFLFLSTFSLFVSYDIAWSIRKLLFLFSIFPLFFLISGLNINNERKYVLLKYLIWGAGLSAFVGIFQFLLQFIIGITRTFALWSKIIIPFLGKSFSQSVLENPSWLVNIGGIDFFRSFSFFPDPHMFSFYLGMALPIAISLYFFKKEKILIFLAGVIFIANILTFSRGGYVALLIAFLFGVIVFWRKIQEKYKKYLYLCFFVFFLIIVIPNPANQRFFSTFNFSEGSNIGRIETWNSAIEVINKYPLLGVGLGNYPLAIKPSANYREPIYAHNLYLDIAAETGLLNSILFITFLLFSITMAIKKGLTNKNFSVIYLGIGISLLIFFTHSFFETALFSVRVLPFLIILLALNNYTHSNKKIK